MIFLTTLLLSMTQVSASNLIAYPALNESVKRIEISPDLILLDHWFFKGETENCWDYKRSEPNIIKLGECFGFRVDFYTTKPTIKVHIEFKMPGVPDHFHFSVGQVTFSEDRKTAMVDIEAKTEKGYLAYYLHKDQGDSTGPEEVSFSVEGILIDTYRFIVSN